MSTTTLGPGEASKLDAIEELVASLRAEVGQSPEAFGSVMADRVARIVGSWRFLLIQLGILISYVIWNSLPSLSVLAFDPYPFQALNLLLSFQAAFTAPVILMAQNRTERKDRKTATKAYRTIGHIEDLVKLLAEIEGVGPEDSS